MKVADERGNGSKAEASDYAFRIKGADVEVQQQQLAYSIKAKGLLVGTWATSHIINNMAKFKSFDDVFNQRHTGAGRWYPVQRHCPTERGRRDVTD